MQSDFDSTGWINRGDDGTLGGTVYWKPGVGTGAAQFQVVPFKSRQQAQAAPKHTPPQSGGNGYQYQGGNYWAGGESYYNPDTGKYKVEAPPHSFVMGEAGGFDGTLGGGGATWNDQSYKVGNETMQPGEMYPTAPIRSSGGGVSRVRFQPSQPQQPAQSQGSSTPPQVDTQKEYNALPQNSPYTTGSGDSILYKRPQFRFQPRLDLSLDTFLSGQQGYANN